MTFWEPNAYADRRPLLVARNRIKDTLRRWFARQGFVEVDPACLQVSPGGETHVHAFATAWFKEGGHEEGAAGRPLYLHTSPELAMKKLLAAGEPKIFAFTPCFRNREQASALHAPEFTMLEWYEANADYTQIMDQCGALLANSARAIGESRWRFKGRAVSARASPEAVKVADAFAALAAIDLGATLSPHGSTDRAALAAQAAAIGVRVAANDSWSDLFSRILVERIEPHLGQGRATLLYEYPAAEAALAQVCAHDRRYAERFELYVCGVELANGFGELTDADEQRRRFEIAMADRQRLYGERYPIDEDFLRALSIMPAAGGCALGFDRLVMLATGAPRLADVMWTPLT